VPDADAAFGLTPNAKATAPASSDADGLFGINPKSVAKQAGKLGDKLEKKVGGAIVYGHQHPYEAFGNIIRAPQRALQTLELNPPSFNPLHNFDVLGQVSQNVMNPKSGPRLSNQIKANTGVQAIEQGPLAGSGLPQKLGRAALDVGMDLNDPLTIAPVGDAGKLLEQALPWLHGASAVADAARSTTVGKFLDPEAPLHGLTDYGKSLYESIQNNATQAMHKIKVADDAVVKRYAEEIRSGKIPDAVRALFQDVENIPNAVKGLKPQDITAALTRDRAPKLKAAIKEGLSRANLIHGPNNTIGMLEHPLEKVFNNPAEADAVKKALGEVAGKVHSTSNDVLKLVQKATHLGNKAFLALPFPHGLNLANLAYNKYGVPTLIKGLANAARVSTGTVGHGPLSQKIAELSATGAHSQYSNIFDELGITRLAGQKGTEGAAKALNKVIVPLERGSNFLQNHFLNPLETGLRASALDAEKKLGNTGVEAARQIHKAFGTDAPNTVTRWASELGEPFAKFHAQTTVGSGLRTLATNPGRIANVQKAQQDYNAQVNPGGSAKFHLSTPGLNIAKATMDPMGYLFSLLGPLGAAGEGYSAIPQTEKGHIRAAVSSIAGRYVPLSEAMDVFYRMAQKKRGQAGEKASSDLLPLITGGYYQKPKP
jgi:hypothetical protein